ncbi:MAG: hypothetical protein ACJ75M_22815, partial [Actinomycetes bacterium]
RDFTAGAFSGDVGVRRGQRDEPSSSRRTGTCEPSSLVEDKADKQYQLSRAVGLSGAGLVSGGSVRRRRHPEFAWKEVPGG